MTTPPEEVRTDSGRRRSWRSAILPAAAVAGLYCVLAGLWIAWSDSLLMRLTTDPAQMAMLSLAKGWGFVLVTGLILFAGVVLAFGRGARAAEQLDQRAGELEAANAELGRSQSLYAVSSGVARAITQTHERQALLDEVCRVAVEEGGLAMAWFGRVTPERTIVREAAAGAEGDMLAEMDIRLDDPARSRGPAGASVRQRKVIFSDDIAADQGLERRRDKALALGFNSAAAVPVFAGGEAVGALTMYATTPAFFDHSQIRLLEEIADDVTFALGHLEAERALVESERRLSVAVRNLQTLIDTAPVAIVALDAAGEVTLWNPVAEKVFGWSSEEVVGTASPFPVEGAKRHFEAARTAVAQAKVVGPREVQRNRRDGSLVDVSFSAAPILDEDGSPVGAIGVFVDISERKRAEEQATKTLDRLETLVGTSPIAIAAIDTDHRVTLWNPAAERLFGWSAQEVVGKVSPVVSPDPGDDVAERRRRTLDDGATYADEEVVRLRRDGAPVDVSVSTAPLRDADGTVIGSLAMWVDITDRRHAQEEVLRLNQELEARVAERTAALTESNRQLELATRAKSAFLATMSHELRTPLNSIIGFSSILREQMAGPLNEEQAKQLDIVHQSARHLLALINGVLTLSKVEAGREELVMTEFDLDEAVAVEVERVRPLAARKGLALSLKPSGIAAPMRSDRTKLGQVLLNLLSNAIKFTESGSVEVTVAVEGGVVRVAVRDTGRGIEPRDVDRIFEDFYQVPSSPGEQDGGTGLGLPLSRRLAQLLRGTIEVRSVLGEGSEFTLAIPLDFPVSRAS